MRIIFSKDRPAQLDLLLRSIRKHMWHEPTKVIWEVSSARSREFYDGYGLIPGLEVTSGSFDDELRGALLSCPDDTVTFFCDDDVVFRPVPRFDLATMPEAILTVSLRLGKENAQMPWPGAETWDWTVLPRHQFGFPASVDGHTFRVEDVWEMIGDDWIQNPTMLETAMALRVETFTERRPLMGCFEEQKLVGIPVNRVSESSGCLNGQKHPQSTKYLNDRFLAGERIDLDSLDLEGVDDVLYETEYKWGETND